MKTVFVFLAQGFEEIEAITIIDILRRAELHVTSVSIEDTITVKGAHGISVLADKLFSETDFSQGDMLVLPGGMPGTSNLNAFEDLKKLLEAYNNDEKKYIAAICAAPLILGQMGLLQGKKAVCYPGFENQLLGATILEDRVVVDGKTITSKGPGSAMEFSIKLIEVLLNKDIAQRIASALIVR